MDTTTLKENQFKRLPATRELCNVCGRRWAAQIQLQHGDHIVRPCNKCFQQIMREQRWAQRRKEVASALRAETVEKAGDPIRVLIAAEGESKFRLFTQVNPGNRVHGQYAGFQKVFDKREQTEAEFDRVVKLIKEDKPLEEKQDEKDKPADGQSTDNSSANT